MAPADSYGSSVVFRWTSKCTQPNASLAGSVKQPGTKDLERQRTSFFQSLRRTSAKASDSDKPVHPSCPSTPPAHTAPPTLPTTEAPTQLGPTQSTQQNSSAASNGVSSSQQQDSASHASEMSNGHDRRHSWDASDPRSKVPAEEEAFLRSLGWTEAGEDEDGESASPLLHTQACVTPIMPRADALVNRSLLIDDSILEVVLYVFPVLFPTRAKVSAFSAQC